MPTRNISLTEHFDQFVEDSIESGSYLNASEVVREGLRLLEHKTREEALKLARLKEATEAGFAAIDRGDSRPIPQIPWPEVQPPPSRVPNPTKSPAAMMTAQLAGSFGVAIP